MIRIALTRLKQGHRTILYPAGPAPALPDRFRGGPVIDAARCREGCSACAQACPTEAITPGPTPTVDLGRCLFCTDCVEACPEKAIEHRRDFRLAVRRREDLVVEGDRQVALAAALEKKLLRLFGRSLRLRQVSAGGCNGCELDVNVLSTIGWDLGRFGIQFVASPRHADGLLITGPVTRNMEGPLRKAWEATPGPKVVIAVGACAISGGVFAGHEEVGGGAAEVVPVDLFIPGCPPHPLTVLDGLLRLIGRIESDPARRAAVAQVAGPASAV